MAAKSNPFTFLTQVRTETSKVVWPSRRETMISTVMVMAMVVFASAFFFVADMVFAYVMGLLQGASF
ncbi:preprotein translocase subunit SecE [Aureimonas psammosilenae]|uniref:preprotein translocase subunit SecE n=1 Tax=Aureimonas psammosilenae TaxID=2495496 RepID=UPI001260E0CD|nr:preprotein translocase subunit SecE [Aureimonas psammosilenae]